MKQIDLRTWEEFEEWVVALSRERVKRSKTGRYVSEYLFRGQPDSSWSLSTTLERFTGRLLTLQKYHQIVLATKPQVETISGETWELPSLAEYMKNVQEEGPTFPLYRMPAYEYHVYLRHHGFPSPLLDWSASPSVAAYFALRDVSSKAARVSVYAYCEYTAGGKSWSSDQAGIFGLGPYVRSHRRHFQQQSQYTVCVTNRGADSAFARHDDAFGANKEDQDELWKITIPASERPKVLERLQLQNVNAFHFSVRELDETSPSINIPCHRLLTRLFTGTTNTIGRTYLKCLNQWTGRIDQANSPTALHGVSWESAQAPEGQWLPEPQRTCGLTGLLPHRSTRFGVSGRDSTPLHAKGGSRSWEIGWGHGANLRALHK
jgi:hypothetical protein